SNLPDRDIPALERADVVTCRKEVGSIQANAETLGLLYSVKKLGQMLDSVSQASSLPRRVLECDAHGRLPGRGENLIQARGDLLDARSFARAQVRARVQHHKREPELG